MAPKSGFEMCFAIESRIIVYWIACLCWGTKHVSNPAYNNLTSHLMYDWFFRPSADTVCDGCITNCKSQEWLSKTCTGKWHNV